MSGGRGGARPRGRLPTLQSAGPEPTTPLRREIAGLGPWFHNVRLPDGTQTAPDHPLGDFPRCKWEAVEPHVPEALDGRSVLDVGCNAGFYSAELARRGARVVAIDTDPHYLRQARWLRRRLSLGDCIEIHQQSVYELAREPAQFDIVWFMGVLYHLRHPLLALDVLASKTRGLLALQTLTLPEDAPAERPADVAFEERSRLAGSGWPRMSFIEDRLAGDPTNWWVPSPACVEAMVRSCGLRVAARPAEDTWVCERDPDDPRAAERERELEAATGAARS